MALLVCRKCGTRFSVGAPHCPQCAHVGAYIEGTEEDQVAHARVADDYPENQPGHPDYVDPDAESTTDEPAVVDEKPAPKKATPPAPPAPAKPAAP